jgi:hypothetical protein
VPLVSTDRSPGCSLHDDTPPPPARRPLPLSLQQPVLSRSLLSWNTWNGVSAQLISLRAAAGHPDRGLAGRIGVGLRGPPQLFSEVVATPAYCCWA